MGGDPGRGFAQAALDTFTVRGTDAGDYARVLQAVQRQGKTPRGWCMPGWYRAAGADPRRWRGWSGCSSAGFYSLLALTQALGDTAGRALRRSRSVTTECTMYGRGSVCPAKAALYRSRAG